MLNLQQSQVLQVSQLADIGLALIGCGNAQYLVIAAFLITHAEHADGAATDESARESGLGYEDHGIQGVSVLAECPFDEAIVTGILR